MALPSYWQPDWFLTGWFPAVWFAPADETGVPPDELRQDYSGGHNAPPLASPRYPQGRKRNLRLENEKVRTRTIRRQEEDLLTLR